MNGCDVAACTSYDGAGLQNEIGYQENIWNNRFKCESSSFIIGSGLILNATKGITGSSRMPDEAVDIRNIESEYISKYNIGLLFSAGFRANRPNKTVSWNFMLFNLIFRPNFYMKYHLKLEIEVKLKNSKISD